MNAALLLVTTAWFAGADAAPAAKPEKIGPPAANAQAPIAPPMAAPYAGGGGCDSCGGCDTCGDCCESHGHKLREKFRGMFGRKHGGESCCEAAPSCGCAAPAPAPACESCGGGCDTCGECCESRGHKLLGKLKGLFRRGGECCGGCDTCGGCDSCGAAPAMPGAPLPIIDGAPKGTVPPDRMPAGPKKTAQPLKPVGLDNAPAAAPNVIIESEKSPF